MIKKELIPYTDNDTELEGFVAYPSGKKSPLVILCHAWKGRDDFITEKAELLASWGYVGFAIDMYGKGILGKSKEENALLKKPFVDNRCLLQTRLLKGVNRACSLPYVDSNRIASLGFGFGGICALDLARRKIDLKGAISVYGHFDSPYSFPVNSANPKILIIHGYNDPISPMSELLAFQKEMEAAKVDWQAYVYSNTFHAFASPAANDLASGIMYNPSSAKRAWHAIEYFLAEVLA